MNNDVVDDIFVPNELPDILGRIFTIDTVLKRPDLTGEQKLGYLQGVNELLNFMRTCVEERGR